MSASIFVNHDFRRTTKIDLKFESLKIMGVLFYEYITVFLKNLELRNIILKKNPFQNAQKNTIFDKRN